MFVMEARPFLVARSNSTTCKLVLCSMKEEMCFELKEQ